MSPAVSILMSVYNGEPYLRDSIESILGQVFLDFEFIVINDGSTDKSLKILKEYQKKDDRIVLVNQQNTGLTKALNRGAAMAKGKFIARQDADDISLPHRLKFQLSCLNQNPEIVVLGAKAEPVHRSEKLKSANFDRAERPLSNVRIIEQSEISRENAIPHASVIFRKDVFDTCGGYDVSFRFSQDFDLWNRMALFGKIALLDQVLLLRRQDSNSISRKHLLPQMFCAAKIRWKHRKRHGVLSLLDIMYLGLRHFIWLRWLGGSGRCCRGPSGSGSGSDRGN